jgi:hypothetical protein
MLVVNDAVLAITLAVADPILTVTELMLAKLIPFWP